MKHRTGGLPQKLGQQDVLLAPPITLLGEQLPPLLSLFPRLCVIVYFAATTAQQRSAYAYRYKIIYCTWQIRPTDMHGKSKK